MRRSPLQNLMRRISAGLICAAVATSAPAMFAMPNDAPVDRIVANLAKRLEKDQRNADLHYTLARTHHLAFTLKQRTLRVYGDVATPNVGLAPDRLQSPADPKSPDKPLTDADLIGHLENAVRHYHDAIALRPDSPDAYLGLASLLELAQSFADRVAVAPFAQARFANSHRERSGPTPLAAGRERVKNLRQGAYVRSAPGGKWERTGPPVADVIETELAGGPDIAWRDEDALRGVVMALLEKAADSADPERDLARKLLRVHWTESITDTYFKAFSLAMPRDANRSKLNSSLGEQIVAREAAEAYTRLVTARGPRDWDQVRLKTAQAAIEAFKALPESNAITPIIFPLDRDRPLASLLDGDARTNFDLDGTGRALTWSWVQPQTAILVWDPQHTGRITSGRQLFGSVTWWLFFPNGYAALDALDDNDDGQLTGAELAGLSVWTDQNSSGAADPGEVTPVQRAGIAAIATRGYHADPHDSRSFTLPSGIRFTDGRRVSSFDWVTSFIPNPITTPPLPPARH